MINILDTIKIIFMNDKDKIMVNNRTLTCESCEYYKLNKCTKCSCPSAGEITNKYSRCPVNKWEDGWGDTQPNLVQSIFPDNTKIPTVFWDEDTSTYISEDLYNQKFPTIIFTDI